LAGFLIFFCKLAAEEIMHDSIAEAAYAQFSEDLMKSNVSKALENKLFAVLKICAKVFKMLMIF
jgi:hypothetical protein